MMRKRGSIVCKLRPCLPKGPTNAASMDNVVTAAAIFANETYIVDTPRMFAVMHLYSFLVVAAPFQFLI
jgi:hypothetical protein